MRARVAVVYNEPVSSRYDHRNEQAAVVSVLEAVAAVHQALLELGYDAIRVSLSLPLAAAREKLNALATDLVFNLFEGFPGRPETEAEIPNILAKIGMPFTGCPGVALRLALDKAETNRVLREAGIATPDCQLLTPATIESFRLNYPCIIKPAAEDASHSLSEKSVVYDLDSLKEQVAEISHAYGGQVLVEEFIGGREFNVTVMGNTDCTVLPISEINYSLPEGSPQILTFAAKWQPDSPYFQGTNVTCPARIGSEYQKRIESTALKTFRRLGLRGYGRVDLRQDNQGRFKVIDVNPNPDISPGAGAARQAAAAGMSYNQFIKKITQLALERQANEDRDSTHDSRGQTGAAGNTAGYARVQASGSGGS